MQLGVSPSCSDVCVGGCLGRYVRDGKDKALQECEERVRKFSEEMEAKSGEKKTLEKKKDTLTKQLANAKVRCHH